MKRLFTGIAVDPAQLGPLLKQVDAMRAAYPGLRWSDRAGWHVTLQFYGMVSEEREHELRKSLQTVQAEAAKVLVQGMGAFERAGVLFARVQTTAALEDIERRVVAVGTACGFAAETRPYRPHITLARRKGRGAHGKFPRGRDMDAEQKFGSFLAREFVLYESVTGPAGARYEVLERYRLSG